MKTRTKQSLDRLCERDLWSLILFVLYKLQDVPELSSLSRLSYILDKENMLKLCTYFGGLTLKIPTIEELETMIYALLLYQWIEIESVPFEEALERIREKTNKVTQAKNFYLELSQQLCDYEFPSSK